MSAFREGPEGPYVVKDPNATLDYLLAWKDWLNGDTISTAAWEVDVGLTKQSDSVNASPVTIDGVSHPAATVATVWLTGGTAGQKYLVRCRITTVAGRVDDRSFRVMVADK